MISNNSESVTRYLDDTLSSMNKTIKRNEELIPQIIAVQKETSLHSAFCEECSVQEQSSEVRQEIKRAFSEYMILQLQKVEDLVGQIKLFQAKELRISKPVMNKCLRFIRINEEGNVRLVTQSGMNIIPDYVQTIDNKDYLIQVIY